MYANNKANMLYITIIIIQLKTILVQLSSIFFYSDLVGSRTCPMKTTAPDTSSTMQNTKGWSAMKSMRPKLGVFPFTSTQAVEAAASSFTSITALWKTCPIKTPLSSTNMLERSAMDTEKTASRPIAWSVVFIRLEKESLNLGRRSSPTLTRLLGKWSRRKLPELECWTPSWRRGWAGRRGRPGVRSTSRTARVHHRSCDRVA